MKKPLSPDQRRALRHIAWSGDDGITEGLLIAHGISAETLAELIKAGLATAHPERLGRPKIRRRVLQITNRGREVISRAADSA